MTTNSVDRNGEIKDLVCKILSYYSIDPSTEYPIYGGEKVDVVGFTGNAHLPEIGIEITNSMNHNLSKLINFKFPYLVIENENANISSNVIKADDKSIKLFQSPDKNRDFEDEIRIIQSIKSDTPYYFEICEKLKISIENENGSETLLLDIIKGEKLNIDNVKNVIIRSALGGFPVGIHKFKSKIGASVFERFSDTANLYKEEIFLESIGVIYKSDNGKSYEIGKTVIAHLNEEYRNIAIELEKELVEKNNSKLKNLIDEYGKTAIFLSLIGSLGEYFEITPEENKIMKNIGRTYTNILSLDCMLGVSATGFSVKSVLKALNIDKTFFQNIRVAANTHYFKENYTEKVFNSLLNLGLANKTYGKNHSKIISPYPIIIQEIGFSSWFNEIDRNLITKISLWSILNNHNPSVPNTLFDSISAIGSELYQINEIISETENRGLTSSLIPGNKNTLSLYDSKKFHEYCDMKIIELLEELMEN